MPRLYIINDDQPNAFATGRNPENAAVAVNTGLIDLMSREEVAGVIAHELAHIRNRDTLIMTVTATIAGAISMLANFGMFFSAATANNNGGFGPMATILMMILAPLAAMVVQMAISRTREYAADRAAARSAATRYGWPPACRSSSTGAPLSRACRRSTTRPRRTCSSSTRCPGADGQSVLDPPQPGEPHCGAAWSRRRPWA